MATTQESPRKFRVLDTSPIRHDGMDKVTGRARFGADFHTPGTIHGKILRSPHAHARIQSIDTRKVETLPGVKAVVTADDFPIIDQPSPMPSTTPQECGLPICQCLPRPLSKL